MTFNKKFKILREFVSRIKEVGDAYFVLMMVNLIYITSGIFSSFMFHYLPAIFLDMPCCAL